MRLGRYQEEILKLHTFGRSARRKLDTLHLPEHKGHRIPQFHAREMDSDT